MPPPLRWLKPPAARAEEGDGCARSTRHRRVAPRGARGRFFYGWCVGLICLWALGLSAAVPESNIVAIRSRGNGQFIAYGVPRPSSLQFSAPQEGRVLLRLDPMLLVVICDRVKQALLQELQCPDQWRGQILINIRFTASTNQPVLIDARTFTDGWQARMQVPDEIESSKLVRVLVQTLLLEMANRQSQSSLTEVPLWMVEGLTRLILLTEGNSFLPQPQTRQVQVQIKTDPLKAIRAGLRDRLPIAFNELCFPAPDQLVGEPWQGYQTSAALFMYELMRLPKGGLCLLNMLARLPQHLNWQTAFFENFGEYFQRPLDVEKWWAIAVQNALGREQWQGWSMATSYDKLDEILHVPVQIRTSPQSLPNATQVSLQTFLQQWDYPVQHELLQRKISQLKAAQINMAQPLANLTEHYRLALETYLQNRDQNAAGGPPRKGQVPVRPQSLVNAAVKQLILLDKQRILFKPKPAETTGAEPPPAALPANPVINGPPAMTLPQNP
jgi:hypothetical protein